MPEERLQKILARAGYGSRRACEELILKGHVAVNGQIVTELGVKADPERDRITVDEQPIHLPKRHVYLALYKPRGYISEMDDSEGRKTLTDLVPDLGHIFPVGRLDRTSEGLVLLTSDGDLAHRLTHPRYAHEKEYYVLVHGEPTEKTIRSLRRGIVLEEGRTAPAEVEILPHAGRWGKAPRGQTWLRFVLRQGWKRQIRRMCAAVGHPVARLIRVRIGTLELGGLDEGEYRPLTSREVNELKRLVQTPVRRTYRPYGRRNLRARDAYRPVSSRGKRRK